MNSDTKKALIEILKYNKKMIDYWYTNIIPISMGVEMTEELIDLLERSDAVDLHKFPSLDDVVNLVSYRSDTLLSVKDIEIVYDVIKKSVTLHN